MTQRKNTSQTKDIRGTLATALDQAMKGGLSREDGRTIIGIANQISQSMAVECKVLTLKHKLGQQVEKYGELAVA